MSKEQDKASEHKNWVPAHMDVNDEGFYEPPPSNAGAERWDQNDNIVYVTKDGKQEQVEQVGIAWDSFHAACFKDAHNSALAAERELTADADKWAHHYMTQLQAKQQSLNLMTTDALKLKRDLAAAQAAMKGLDAEREVLNPILNWRIESRKDGKFDLLPPKPEPVLITNEELILRLISDSLERVAASLETVIDKKKRTLRMVDVDRGRIYKTQGGLATAQAAAQRHNDENGDICRIDISDTACLDAAIAAAVKPYREALEQLDAWCDERRNAPDWTTLGMVQAKLQELLAKTEGK